jgi:hypothetical protein
MMKTLLTAAVLLGTAVLSPVGAATFTSDHCTGGCGDGSATGQPGGFATITGAETAPDTVVITITPLNGNTIVGSGLTTFTFNLTTNVAITYSPLPTGFDVVNSGNNTQVAGEIHNNGFGIFEYGIDYNPNGAPGFSGPLTFTLTGAGLTLDDFAERSKGGDVAAFFALDILSGTTGKTGLVDCCVGQPTPFGAQVPIPAALPLFAGGLGVMGLVGWRRRRKQAAA